MATAVSPSPSWRSAAGASRRTCTHAGCSLANGRLEGTTVTCACHGSQFDVTSGAVLRGPAQRPVRAHAVRVEGENLLAEP